MTLLTYLLWSGLCLVSFAAGRLMPIRAQASTGPASPPPEPRDNPDYGYHAAKPKRCPSLYDYKVHGAGIYTVRCELDENHENAPHLAHHPKIGGNKFDIWWTTKDGRAP